MLLDFLRFSSSIPISLTPFNTSFSICSLAFHVFYFLQFYYPITFLAVYSLAFTIRDHPSQSFTFATILVSLYTFLNSPLVLFSSSIAIFAQYFPFPSVQCLYCSYHPYFTSTQFIQHIIAECPLKIT